MLLNAVSIMLNAISMLHVVLMILNQWYVHAVSMMLVVVSMTLNAVSIMSRQTEAKFACGNSFAYCSMNRKNIGNASIGSQRNRVSEIFVIKKQFLRGYAYFEYHITVWSFHGYFWFMCMWYFPARSLRARWFMCMWYCLLIWAEFLFNRRLFSLKPRSEKFEKCVKAGRSKIEVK